MRWIMRERVKRKEGERKGRSTRVDENARASRKIGKLARIKSEANGEKER